MVKVVKEYVKIRLKNILRVGWAAILVEMHPSTLRMSQDKQC